MDFIKTGCAQFNVFAYLILDKCERRLKKMMEDCKGQKGYEDINLLLTHELMIVQNQISDFRVDLIRQNVDLVKLVDAKSFLSSYFYES